METGKEVKCADCGLLYSKFGLDFVLPDQQWQAIAHDGVNILCGNCIALRAEKLGTTAVLIWLDNLDYGKVPEKECTHDNRETKWTPFYHTKVYSITCKDCGKELAKGL